MFHIIIFAMIIIICVDVKYNNIYRDNNNLRE